MHRHMSFDENGEKVFVDLTEDDFAEQNPVTPTHVKAEAHRRIIAIIPEWKQRNLIAQAALLAEKGRANWSAEETVAWDAGKAIWAQIDAIRARSDEIAAMDPVPTDITVDTLWND